MNDREYVHDDEEYVNTNVQFGGFGALGQFDGAVNIGGNRPRTASRTITTSPPPSPPIFVIDTNRNAALRNNQDDDSSLTKADIKIIRQEQEADENGYRYL